MGEQSATTRVCVLILAAALGRPALAAGQPQQQQPRIEVGAGGGVFAAISGKGLIGLLMAVGPRLSVNVNDRTSVDLIADIAEPNESSGLYGLYGIQLRHLVREGDRTRAAVFITGGAVGGFEYERVAERRTERRDGSAVVYRAYTEGQLTSPAAFSGGIGMQRVLARRAAFRAETQVIVGFGELGGMFLTRATLGLSIPIGGTYGQTR